MTTYTRLLSDAQIAEIVAASGVTLDTKTAVQATVRGEELWMSTLVEQWYKRANSLELPLKGVKSDQDRAAFMDGAINALVISGTLSQARAEQIAMLAILGRLTDYMEAKRLP